MQAVGVPFEVYGLYTGDDALQAVFEVDSRTASTSGFPGVMGVIQSKVSCLLYEVRYHSVSEVAGPVQVV